MCFSESVISETWRSLRFALFIPEEVPKKQAVPDCDTCPLRFSILRFLVSRWFKDLVSKCGNQDVLQAFLVLLFRRFCTQFTHLLRFQIQIFIALISVYLLKTD